MKWGKKKTSSFLSSRTSLISHVLPTSWLTKFKHVNIISEQKHTKLNQKGKWNSAHIRSPQCGSNQGGGRFYGGDGDAFWRLSFGEDGVDGKTSRSVLRSVWYNSEDEVPDFPASSCHRCRPNATHTKKFSNMASDVRKIGGLPTEIGVLPETDVLTREKIAEIRTPRLRVEREKKLKEIKRVSEDNKLHVAEKISRKVVKKTNEMVDYKLGTPDFYPRRVGEKESQELLQEIVTSEWQKLKEMKIGEVKSKTEKQRKSLYISRNLGNSKVRIYSPRTTEVCRIKALEDMKKAKLKKKKVKVKTIENTFMGLESFAVVKCSFDPQKDFRDSMMEMIQEKRISQPEELEELLACYLTLNSDEYHDMIIKVFRQVWFQLNLASFDTVLENEHCYHD